MHNDEICLRPNLEKFLAGNSLHVELLFSFFANDRKLPDTIYEEGIKYIEDNFSSLNSQDKLVQFGMTPALWVSLHVTAKDLDSTLISNIIGIIEEAILLGSILAYTGKALFLIKDKGTVARHPEAVELLRSASGKGCKIATTYLAKCYAEGIGMPADTTEAVRLYRIASEAGFHSATTRLADCYLKGIGVAKNNAENIRLLQMASDAGFSEATSNLAMHYLEGKIVAKNLPKAIKLLHIASDACIVEATSQLAVCYIQGDMGTPKSLAAGIKLLVIAAQAGDCISAYNLGNAFYTGEGVSQNMFKAARLFSMASDGCVIQATYNLALFNQKGIGVLINYDEAFRLYKIASDAGYSRSSQNLGACYFLGLGTTKDLKAAVACYLLAINNAKDVETVKVGLISLQLTLKQLQFNIESFIEIAKCCVKVCRNLSFEEAHPNAKETLSSLKTAYPNNFEVQYYAAVTLGDAFLSGLLFNSKGAAYSHIALPVKKLIGDDPNRFIACLIKDKIISPSYKQSLFAYITEYYLPNLSGSNVIVCLHSLNDLHALRANPKSYFSLLSLDNLNTLVGTTIDVMEEVSTHNQLNRPS